MKHQKNKINGFIYWIASPTARNDINANAFINSFFICVSILIFAASLFLPSHSLCKETNQKKSTKLSSVKSKQVTIDKQKPSNTKKSNTTHSGLIEKPKKVDLKKNPVNSNISSAACVQVRGIRIWPSPDSTRVVLDLNAAAEYQQKEETGSDGHKRIILLIKNGDLKTNLSQCVLTHTRIKHISSDLKSPNQLTLTLELEKPLKPNSFTLSPNQEYGHRLVLDLEDENAAEVETEDTAPASGNVAQDIPLDIPDENKETKHAEKEAILAMFAADGENQTPSKTSIAKTQPGVEPKTMAAKTADKDSRPATTPSKTLSRAKKPFIVAIDAGHGGEDPGAIGRFGTREKDVVLAISRYLKTMIDQEPDMKAVLIRSGDYYVGLKNRMSRARKYKADLFVSVHADAFQDRRAEGASVFTLSEHGASSTAAKWLADRENRSDLIGGVKLSDKNKVLASVLLDLTQSASKEEGLKAAQHVLQALGKVGSLHRGQVEQAGFAVLKAPDVPSLLVETGFISHPATERKLKTPAYQKKIASAIMGGIRQYAHKRPH